MVAHEAAFMYFETVFPDGTSDSFLVDDVTVESVAPPAVQDITPIKDTVEFRMGVAIDSRETAGPASELVERHFDQVTPENHMKPAAWYDEARNFRTNPEATAIMDFAQANGSEVYGHTLLWHQQTPDWFFETDDGTPLTNSASDQQVLRDRLRTHIFDVARMLSGEYGLFGSDTNPLRSWDVVNEVISDGVTDDGLRRSRWYEVLGEGYVDQAFRDADEAFNRTYAAPGTDRSVMLTINDYSTEQEAKRTRLLGLVERLLARGVPVDAIGHQFHVNLFTPVEALAEAIDAFADLPVTQLVSELDVPTGTPVTEALLIDHGYYYRDAFRIFRERAGELYSVSVWGLTDDRSWLAASGDPLIFDSDLQAKPAYHGVVDGELPLRQRSANVFMSDGDTAIDAPTWERLPLNVIDDATAFQLRWTDGALTAYVEAADTTVDGTDRLTFVVDDATYTVGRDGSGDLTSTVVETDTGYTTAVELPAPGAAEGATVAFDVQVTDADSTIGWNEAGATGTLSLIEALSFTETVQASTVPTVDATIDDVWTTANSITTDKVIQGDDGGASAVVRTLWADDALYVVAEVTDATPDVSASDPYQQDSLEIFLDVGNAKNGSYRSTDSQIRINSANEVSFGAGDAAGQAARLTSATTTTPSGYMVEASIGLLEQGGPGTFHGLDFQVNDGDSGTRSSVRNWADPTGVGYQTTSHWGVTQLVAGDFGPTCDQTVTSARRDVHADEGVLCLLSGSIVLGSVSVTSGASLVADEAVIYGTLRTRDATSVAITGTVVVRGLSIQRTAEEVTLSRSVVAGPVKIMDNDVTGDIVVSANWFLAGARCRDNTPAPGDDGRPNVIIGRNVGQCSS